MLLSQLSEESKKLFLDLELLMANVDGSFDDSEKKIIERHCNEMGIEMKAYDENTQLQDVVSRINNEMSVKEKKIIFLELITVAIIDGVYDDKEKELVEAVRKLLLIPEELGGQAYDLVKKLIDVSTSIENFVEW